MPNRLSLAILGTFHTVIDLDFAQCFAGNLKLLNQCSAGDGCPNDYDAIIPARNYGRLDAYSNRVGLALAV